MLWSLSSTAWCLVCFLIVSMSTMDGVMFLFLSYFSILLNFCILCWIWPRCVWSAGVNKSMNVKMLFQLSFQSTSLDVNVCFVWTFIAHGIPFYIVTKAGLFLCRDRKPYAPQCCPPVQGEDHCKYINKDTHSILATVLAYYIENISNHNIFNNNAQSWYCTNSILLIISAFITILHNKMYV